MWQSLIANFAVVGLFGFAWLHSQTLLRQMRRPYRSAIFGVATGAGAIISMLLTSELQPGVYFDLRGCFVAMAAYLGGPIAAGIAAVLTGSYRAAMGGAGVAGALMSIGLISAVGLGARALSGRHNDGRWAIMAFSLASALAPLGGFTLLPEGMLLAALEAAVPIVALGFVATFTATRLLVLGERRMEEEKLVRTAFAQAPDYLFVKDRQSRFVAVNNLVATHHGYGTPDELRGRTDFDIASAHRARELFDSEQELIRTGGVILDREELIDPDADPPRWVLTSKVAVRNVDGEVIGLAGASRNISERKALEKALLEGRDQLDLVLTAMSDGLARFDEHGILQFSNERYRSLFPLTSDVRVPGSHLADILQAVIERGEQTHVPTDHRRWVDGITRTLEVGGEEEVPMFDGRWLHIRTRPMPGGGATVVVSDITNLKRAEAGLVALTEQLRQMATTDALTGLVNRRGFDERLEDEAARAARNHLPLSLVMIDIDRFKAYNDRYGHQAGDECLKLVAATLRAGLRRPADVAARYGGEEMALILPETGHQGAYELAETLRRAVHGLEIAHAGSERGQLTVSLGVATLGEGAPAGSAAELIRRADAALYIAKEAGRDRVMGWGERLAARA
jgi:diguanylate cyclase (GGDEF)-like protein/PAS domain S-box-containing protein